MGAERDTVILFLSDNGASSEQLIRGDGHDTTAPLGSARSFLGLGPGWASNSNAPFRLHKSWVNEGGISSPLIVHWPNGIKDQNKLRHDPCHFVDVLPTLVDLAGGSTVDARARRRWPAGAWRRHSRKTGPSRTTISISITITIAPSVWATWKLIATGDDGPWELYDLAKDRCEQHNLAAANPDRGEAVGGAVERARRRVRPGARGLEADHEAAHAPRVISGGAGFQPARDFSPAIGTR